MRNLLLLAVLFPSLSLARSLDFEDKLIINESIKYLSQESVSCSLISPKNRFAICSKNQNKALFAEYARLHALFQLKLEGLSGEKLVNTRKALQETQVDPILKAQFQKSVESNLKFSVDSDYAHLSMANDGYTNSSLLRMKHAKIYDQYNQLEALISQKLVQ
ncbi:hypothetical protein [Vibrio maerlii]|uniref:hypothetical protein n=1 Tax=Vibrio maerlii TaxID=2231648 RepID=UPI000E3C8DCA|nr:hypothetical protein [Vibrio maerlii]